MNFEKMITAQKMKFFIKNLFSKCHQILNKMRIWSHLLKKSIVENLIFCAVDMMKSFGFLEYLFSISSNENFIASYEIFPGNNLPALKSHYSRWSEVVIGFDQIPNCSQYA